MSRGSVPAALPADALGGNHRRRRLPTLIAVVALSGLCGRAQAAPAQQPPNLPPAQEQAASGQTSAYFYYTKADDSGFTTFTDLRLVIVRAGAIIYDAAVPRYNKQFEVVPAGYGNRRSVFVSDLDRDSEPEVRLDLFWNGAHCCFWTDVYRYQPA